MEVVLSKETHIPVQDVKGAIILKTEQNITSILMLNKITQEILYVPLNDDVKNEFSITEELSEGFSEEPHNEEVDSKIWSRENTLFLINVINKYDKEFASGVKKNIWQKVADECKELHRNITSKLCESKWKSLKRTYKNIISANNTSGEKRRYWEYFNVLHEIMYNKPEINPVATCSSMTGLKIHGNSEGTSNTKKDTEDQSSSENENKEFESVFSRKRKQRISEVERRHAEKMKQLNRFNDLFEKMVNKIPDPKD